MPNQPHATIARSIAGIFAPLTPKLALAKTGKGIPYFVPALPLRIMGISTTVLPRKIVSIACHQFIPPSIRDVLSTDDNTTLPRRELKIIAKARDLSLLELVAGDYATVSPFYSDVDLAPEFMQNVMTPRLIYPFKHSYYITRGVSMKSGGYGQYVGLTADLCNQDFFRPGYSTGEEYFYEKSKGIGKNATNGTVVKPSVVAHISYMVLGAKL